MAVHMNSRRQQWAAECASRETGGRTAFGASPTVVATRTSSSCLEVDFLNSVLTNVCDPKISGRAVKAAPPRITHSGCPHRIVSRCCAASEGIVGWNGVVRRGPASGRLDSMEFAESLNEILRTIARVIGTASITNTHVQVAVWTKLNPAAIVVRLGIRPRHHDYPSAVGDIGVGRHGVSSQVVGTCSGVINIELTVRGVIGVEGHAQEALLIAR